MTNKSVAKSLKETAALIELTGGNPFRSRALAGAARTIERLDTPVDELIQSGTLTEIKGIGAGLQDQIRELLNRGSFELRDDLLGGIPPGLLDVLAIKGLGAKKVRELWKTLGIQTLDDLEIAALSGHIATISGFGEKSQESILTNIAALRSYRERRHFAEAWQRATTLVEDLRRVPGVVRIELAGEVRRCFETVGSVSIIIGSADGKLPADVRPITGPLVDVKSTSPDTNSMQRYSGTIADGLPLFIDVCPTEQFGTALFYDSASPEFLAEWERRYGAVAPAADEADIFRARKVAFIEAEIRDDPGIIHEATSGPLEPLIVESDLQGSLHNHSTYSDGANTLREMAEAARGMGLSYFGICDHSRSLKIAYGLSVKEVLRQQEEIRALNLEFEQDGGATFRIFSGTESDILDNGDLDYPDDVLSTFDFVVASVHTGFNMTEAEATDRVVKAISNPFTSILGHPTGRLLLRREGYPLNHEAILDACAHYGVAVELNANPYRLDLDWRWITAARKRNILISINPDAHAIDQLAYHKWGVSVARKGRLTASGCLNTLDLKAFTRWIQRSK